ncbi:hypothetical protein Tco_0786771 [Tanacetum coccineum]
MLSSSTVTYTSAHINSEPWRFQYDEETSGRILLTILPGREIMFDNDSSDDDDDDDDVQRMRMVRSGGEASSSFPFPMDVIARAKDHKTMRHGGTWQQWSGACLGGWKILKTITTWWKISKPRLYSLRFLVTDHLSILEGP